MLRENNINYNNFKINDNNLTLSIDNIDKFDLLFNLRKDNLVNPYIDKYRAYELDYKKSNAIKLKFFKIWFINN